MYKTVTPATIPAEGTTFVLEMMGREAGPDKFVRELIYNSLQSISGYQDKLASGEIAEPDYRPEIRLYVDPYYEWKWGTPKLAIGDNGASFPSVDKFKKIFQHLAVSGNKQGFGLNHGIGGRITTALRNPLGVEYRFWIDGKGYMARMWRDPETELYGLERIAWGGKVLEVISIDEIADDDGPDLMKPDFIKDHGFVVVQLGEKQSDDTTLPPEGFSGNKAFWMTTTANRYFADIPKDIRVANHLERRKDGKVYVRPIEGYMKELIAESQGMGKVELQDADVHWFLLRDGIDPKADRSKPLIERTFAQRRFTRRSMYDAWYSQPTPTQPGQHGFVAVMKKDPTIRSLAEFYDFTQRAAEAVPMLKKFGIYAGYHNVVLIIEPHKVMANLTRTALHGNEGRVQYSKWADEFSKNMPPELNEWVEKHLNANTQDAESEIRALVEKNKEKLFFEAWRVHPKGTTAVSLQDEETAAGARRTRTPVEEATGTPRPERPATPTERTPRRKQTDTVDSEQAFLQLRNLLPRIVFEDEDNDGSLKGRAAQYDTDRHLLTVNRSFRSFKGLLETGHSLLRPEAIADKDVAERVTRQAEVIYGYDLATTIMLARAHLEGTADWTHDDFAKLVSSEGLTACVLSRVSDHNEMRQRVRTLPTLRPFLASADKVDAPPEEPAA